MFRHLIMGESEFLKERPAVFDGVEPEVVIPDLKTLTRRGSLEFSQGVEKVGVAGLSGPANARVGLFVKVVIAAGDDFQCTSPNVDFTAWQSSEIGIGRGADVFKADDEPLALSGQASRLKGQSECGLHVQFVDFVEMNDGAIGT